MISTPNWRHYSAVLERVFDQQATTLFRALPHDQYLFQAGVCYALERLSSLPQELLTHAQEIATHASKHTDGGSERERADRVFLSTPWWTDYSRAVERSGKK